MARLRLPPGVSREDAWQEATEIALRRHGEGKRGSHLFVRVWGDLKDKYGSEWRRHYTVGPTEPLDGYDVEDTRPVSDPLVVLDVRAAVAKLPPAQRHAVEECGLKGRPQAEVAAERGVSVQNVKLLFMRGRRRLAQLLAGYAEGV